MPRKPAPSFGDSMRGAWRSVRNGTSADMFATNREIKAARDERLAQEARYPRPAEDWGWYSKYRQSDGSIHVMLDKSGDLTTRYPHVHVIHDEPGSEVRIVASFGPKDHRERITLPGTASGNEVNAAIDRLRKLL